MSRARLWGSISVLALILVSSVLLTKAAPPEGKQLTIYARATSYSLDVEDRSGREYVALAAVLEPLGKVSAKGDAKKWKLRFEGREGEFRQDSNRARVHGREIDLGAAFVFDKGRGLVPVSALTTLLPAFLETPVLYHANSRRLFISQPGTTYTAELNRMTPPALVLNFSAPVNPSISTEPGKLRMVSSRDPVVASGPETTNFSSQAIASANFQENNGAAELTVAGNVPLLASFSNSGRTITITPAPSAVAAAPAASQQPASAATGANSPQTTQNPVSAQNPAAPMRRIFAVLDASHGGEERGALLSDKLVEKDVTLALARRLREELQNRGVPALVIRDGDATLTLDQRAATSNTARPALYIAFHATNSGSGVRVITAAMPAAPASHPPFLSWDRAQAQWLTISQTAAGSVAASLGKRFTSRQLSAPLRPLNNVTSPAIAIEVGPSTANSNELASPDYQRSIAIAISDGMLAVRDKLEAAR